MRITTLNIWGNNWCDALLHIAVIFVICICNYYFLKMIGVIVTYSARFFLKFSHSHSLITKSLTYLIDRGFKWKISYSELVKTHAHCLSSLWLWKWNVQNILFYFILKIEDTTYNPQLITPRQIHTEYYYYYFFY